MLEMLKMQ